jgi:hypothetical protein
MRLVQGAQKVGQTGPRARKKDVYHKPPVAIWQTDRLEAVVLEVWALAALHHHRRRHGTAALQMKAARLGSLLVKGGRLLIVLPKALPGLNPTNLDRKLFEKLCAEHGGKFFTDRMARMFDGDASDLVSGPVEIKGLTEMDDYAATGVEGEGDIRDRFIPNFFFGCEGEDRMTAVAFDSKKNPLGAKLNAMFGSDIGHFDVLDMREPALEAYKMVEGGIITADDFRNFLFTNPVKLHTGVNPDFFRGTMVEGEVRKLLNLTATALAA